MRFTVEQYNQAIADIDDAKGQLAPNGRVCHICHDSGHQAWECGSNPLLGQLMCNYVAQRANELHDKLHQLIEERHTANMAESDEVREDRIHEGSDETEALALLSDDLHEFLHYLAGFRSSMGVQLGPARMRSIAPESHSRGWDAARGDG